MATIKKVYDRVLAFDSDLAIDQIFRESEDDFVRLNQEQMFAGVKRDGNEIEPPYANLTVAIKQQKGQPTDRVTLKDTGAFYQGLYANLAGNRIDEGSSDPKAEKLSEKYGEEIYGLGGQYKQEFVNDSLKPKFSEKVFQAIGIGPKKI